jgi:hypothetical protein
VNLGVTTNATLGGFGLYGVRGLWPSQSAMPVRSLQRGRREPSFSVEGPTCAMNDRRRTPCYGDVPQTTLRVHPLELVTQRVFGFASLLAADIGKVDPSQRLAGKSPLNRLELSTDGAREYRYNRIE